MTVSVDFGRLLIMRIINAKKLLYLRLFRGLTWKQTHIEKWSMRCVHSRQWSIKKGASIRSSTLPTWSGTVSFMCAFESNLTPFSRWMSDAEGFDVRIVYVCVVNATESRDILSQFIQEGGWNCLAKWLEYFMASNKHAAIRELLLCFQKLPIEAKTLSVQVRLRE